MTHEEKCGKDSLQEIHRHYGAGSDAVVRWCNKCGAVVVDEDYDGRTHPGSYVAMRFPSNLAALTESQKDTERLDWYINSASVIEMDHRGWYALDLEADEIVGDFYKTPREAIDSAIQGEKP